MKFRLIDTGFSTPPMNMAIDEALLISKMPVLRFYQWKPAGLSLGYFQHIKETNTDFCTENNIGIVRRITGGNAVLHDKELTYSFIIDEKEIPKSIIDSYRKISKGILKALDLFGLDAAMNEEVKKEEKSAVCFNDPSWYEIVVNGKKLVGSAQKRVNGKLLQHGAILVDVDIEKYANCFKNCSEELVRKLKQRMTSINEELKKKSSHGADSAGVAPFGVPSRISEGNPSAAKDGWIFSNRIKQLKEALKTGFKEALGIEFIESELSKEEKRLAEKLQKEKYSTNQWNFRI